MGKKKAEKKVEAAAEVAVETELTEAQKLAAKFDAADFSADELAAIRATLARSQARKQREAKETELTGIFETVAPEYSDIADLGSVRVTYSPVKALAVDDDGDALTDDDGNPIYVTRVSTKVEMIPTAGKKAAKKSGSGKTENPTLVAAKKIAAARMRAGEKWSSSDGTISPVHQAVLDVYPQYTAKTLLKCWVKSGPHGLGVEQFKAFYI